MRKIQSFPKVTAVVLSYNNSSEVQKLAESLLKVPLQNVVIVDNASLAEEVRSLQNFSRNVSKVILVQNKTNLGFGAGMNRGIKMALEKGAEYVLLMTVDVELDEDDFLELVRSAADITDPVFKFQRKGKWVYDLGGRIIWPWGRTVHTETNFLVLAKEMNTPVDYVTGACMLIKRETVEKIGYFDERYFMYFEDVDYCTRAKVAGLTVKVCKEATAIHNISEHKFHPNKLKMKYNLKANFRFLQKWTPWYFKPFAYGYFVLLWLFVLLKSTVIRTQISI